MLRFARRIDIVKMYNLTYTTLKKWENKGLIKEYYGCMLNLDEVENAIKQSKRKNKVRI